MSNPNKYTVNLSEAERERLKQIPVRFIDVKAEQDNIGSGNALNGESLISNFYSYGNLD
ncbi:MAG: hypothetical protein V7L21_12780 [Nostoc sp.]|uniref:hypothetical protein n=1 Tax=unclassified Nostoc TaxID=2593658 RepID=UPI0025CE8CE2|nr:hypothetical protein [Nostoc sp. NMS9]MBN3943244.1 hypothetical protein [Nostoc sp. NMS9]